MVHELEVWLSGGRAGILSLPGGRLSFRYLPTWLANPEAIALSCSLPLQAEPFDDLATRPVFAGLLPEGQLRRLIAQQFQVSRQNDFALLTAIGGECAGAITILPKDAAPPTGKTGEVRWLDDQALAAIIDELPLRPMLAGQDGVRLSLAGAQDKLPVVFDGKRIGLPLDGHPSTHILKPPIHTVDNSVINEGFCLALARAIQLPAAEAQVLEADGRHFLLVTRYDRLPDAHSQPLRLHQEDFCQALGVVPEMKYQNEGGPDLAACFGLLRRVTRPSAPQILHLLDYVVLNALVGNHDAHAKNFSLLYASSSTRAAPILAPLYDVLSTAIYPTLTPKMAMKLGSKYKFSEVEARHWEQFAEAAGLARAQTRKRILGMAQTLPSAARALQATPLFAGEPVIEQIVTLIEQRAALTVRRLNSEATA